MPSARALAAALGLASVLAALAPTAAADPPPDPGSVPELPVCVDDGVALQRCGADVRECLQNVRVCIDGTWPFDVRPP